MIFYESFLNRIVIRAVKVGGKLEEYLHPVIVLNGTDIHYDN